MANLQSLSLLDLEAYEKSNSGLQRVKELKNRPILLDISQDFRKRGIAMFLVELLNACLHAEDCEYELYDFLEESIIRLEQAEHVSEFPIRFMLEMAQVLGIEPQSDYSETQRFLNLETGMYQMAGGKNCADEEVSFGIYRLRNVEDKTSLSPSLRKRILNTLILYYQYHLMPRKEMLSVDILSEIMESWHKV